MSFDVFLKSELIAQKREFSTAGYMLTFGENNVLCTGGGEDCVLTEGNRTITDARS